MRSNSHHSASDHVEYLSLRLSVRQSSSFWVDLTPSRAGLQQLSQLLLLMSLNPSCCNKHNVRCVAFSVPMWIRADDMTGIAPQHTDGSPMGVVRPKYLVE